MDYTKNKSVNNQNENHSSNINSNKQTFCEVKKLLHINLLTDMIKEIINYAKHNFDKFSAISLTGVTIVIWMLKTMAYCFQLGSFNLYNISATYIVIDSNFVYAIIQGISIAVIIFLSNFLFLYLFIQTDQSKYHIKKIGKILILFCIEKGFLFLFTIFYSNISLKSLFINLNIYNWKSILLFVGLILVLLCILVIAINIFAIELALFYKRKQKIEQKKDVNCTADNSFDDKKKSIIITIIIIIPCLMIYSYACGNLKERQRTTYKVVEETTDSADETNYKFVFYNGDNHLVRRYIIIYENREQYILSRLYKENGKICIDKEYQKIIDKENIDVYIVDNIYNIDK